MQDIREKIFPSEGRKINAPEATPSVPVPVRRKERSLSSLVVGTPKVPTQTGLTGKRTKAGSRKAGAFVKKEESTEEQPLSSSSPESQSKIVRNKMQVLTSCFISDCVMNVYLLTILCSYSIDTGCFDG